MAMNDEKEKKERDKEKSGQEEDDQEEEEEDEPDFTAGENLLHLVQPEMRTLSRHWLAALKDHALLTLPPGEAASDTFVLFKKDGAEFSININP